MSLLSQVACLWKCEVYRCAATGGALDDDIAPLRVDDGAADGEPKPEPSGLLADGPGAEESLEKPVLLVERDARSLVGDGDAHEPVRGHRPDRYLCALRRAFPCVRDEVREDLGRPTLVREHTHGVLSPIVDQL